MAKKEKITYEIAIEHRQAKEGLDKIQTSTRRTQVGMDKLTTTIKRVNGQITSQKTVMKSGAGVMKQMGSSVKGVMLQYIGLTAVISGLMQSGRKLSEWIKQSITDFREFETNMTEVSTILQGQAYNLLPALTSGVEQLSVAYGKSANDLAKGLYDILSAAIDAEDAIRLLNTSTKASIAGLTLVSTSVDVFTSILNSYGKTVSQAANISDILFQTVIRGKLRFEDLASAMGYITPIAANAGVAFEEIAAALATVTRQGLHVDMATRGLALMLQGIVSPAQAAAKAAEKFNVEMSGLALRVKGLGGFIQELNTATQEYGMVILPQIVRNMRSLRVAMALAGSEGVVGFTDDLDLMRNATGKTEEALSKMMTTQKRQADILAQSLELVERKIGEAWSGVDIWWRKTKLWWAEFLTMGDADKAVGQIEENTARIEASYREMYNNINKVSQKSPFSTILLESNNIEDAFKDLDVTQVEEYLGVMDDLDRKSNLWSIGEKIESITQSIHDLNQEKEMPDWTETFTWGAGEVMAYKAPSPDEINDLNKAILEYNLLAEDSEQLHIALAPGASLKDFRKALDVIKEKIAEADADIDTLGKSRTELQPFFDYFTEGFDTLGQSIESRKLNILELKNAMNALATEVETVYSAFSGEEFKGKLAWAMQIKIDDTQLRRFKEFSSMAIKYDASYMEKYVAEYGELDKELSAAIITMSQYTKEVKEQKKAEAALGETLDENLKLIRLNNLAKMKLQLQGMLQRRGLSRSQQKAMKKLDIDNLKLRIDSMGKEIALEEQAVGEVADVKKTAYDAAKELLDKRIDEDRHGLTVRKDIANDEIKDMDDEITKKRGKLGLYTQWYDEELGLLEAESKTYLEAITKLSEDYQSVYADMFDTEYIQNWMNKFNEYLLLADLGKDIKIGEVASPSGKGKDYYRSIAVTQWKKGFSLSRGIDYVPSDGDYPLHKGETVTRRGEVGSGGGFTIGTVVINVKSIEDVGSVEKVAQLLSEATDSRVITTGKTRARNKKVGNTYRVI